MVVINPSVWIFGALVTQRRHNGWGFNGVAKSASIRYDEIVRKTFTILLWIFLTISFLLAPQFSFAEEECRGIVRDESNNALAEVTIAIYNVQAQPPDTTTTGGDGSYFFRIPVSFGPGSFSTQQVDFSKAGYTTRVFNYRTQVPPYNCPGDVTLASISSTATSVGCNRFLGVCQPIDPESVYNKIYADQASCDADCGIYRLDASNGRCFLDTSGTFFSKMQCEEALAGTSTQLYRYNSTSNTCVPDSTGVTLEECQKQIHRPTIPPFNPTECAADNEACNACVGADPSNPQGIWTGLGCIQTNPGEFIGRIAGIVLGLAGGIALLLIIYSGYRMTTAAGNPEGLQGARETMTAAIVGLLFIIFSFVILEVIGVDILRIPQFGRSVAPGCEVPETALYNKAGCGSSEGTKNLCYNLDSIPEDQLTEQQQAWRIKCFDEGYLQDNSGILQQCSNLDFALGRSDICDPATVRMRCSLYRAEEYDTYPDTVKALYDKCVANGYR